MVDCSYDDNGNILSVSDGTYTISYRYNGANQLIREYNQRAGKIWTWKYNDAGNLTHHREYNYSDTNMTTPLYTMRYTYGDASWGDFHRARTMNKWALRKKRVFNGLLYPGNQAWESGDGNGVQMDSRQDDVG